MADKRYGSIQWKRLRLRVLQRDGYQCTIAGPACRGVANTVDHVIPVSQGGAFFDPRNLRSSCGRCNYSAGAAIASENRYSAQAELDELRHIVQWQEERIEALAAALQAAKDATPANPMPGNGNLPAIH